MDRKLQDNLKKEVKSLFEQKKVDCILGFERGSLKHTTTPVLIKRAEDADRLVINDFITNNLAKMLIKMKGKVGIVAKGCDSRSVVSLLQDNKIKRENIVILGVPCTGLIDINRISLLSSVDPDEIDEITRVDDKVIVTSGSIRKEYPVKEVVYRHCLACDLSTPSECDILLGDPASPPLDREASLQKINELEKMTSEQRWKYWKEQMQKCTRCYACRNVCPVCYCERCFVEESEPQWVNTAPNWQDNLIFQVIRNIHVAGRCTDCGNCERACPVGIPLRSLVRKMYDVVDETFHYKAGTNKNDLPLMASYETREAEELIR